MKMPKKKLNLADDKMIEEAKQPIWPLAAAVNSEVGLLAV